HLVIHRRQPVVERRRPSLCLRCCAVIPHVLGDCHIDEICLVRLLIAHPIPSHFAVVVLRPSEIRCPLRAGRGCVQIQFPCGGVGGGSPIRPDQPRGAAVDGVRQSVSVFLHGAKAGSPRQRGGVPPHQSRRV